MDLNVQPQDGHRWRLTHMPSSKSQGSVRDFFAHVEHEGHFAAFLAGL